MGAKYLIDMTNYWKKSYRGILFWIGFLGSILICYSDLLLSKYFHMVVSGFTFGERLQTVILFATGVIIFWYTKETFDLKRVQQKELKEVRTQTKYEILPFLRLQYNGNPDAIFTIANDGRGLAKDITFDENLMGPESHVLRFTIASRPVISAGGSSNVSADELRKKCAGVLCYGGDIGRHIGRYIENGFQVKAKYKDIVDKQYEVVFQSDPSYNDGFRVVSQSESR